MSNLVSSAFEVTCEDCIHIKGPKHAMVDYVFEKDEKGNSHIVGFKCPQCGVTWKVTQNQ